MQTSNPEGNNGPVHDASTAGNSNENGLFETLGQYYTPITIPGGCLFGIKQTDHGNFIIPFDGDLAQSAGAIFNRRNNQYNNVEFYIAIMQCARIRDNQANVSVLSWYYSTLLQDISQMIPDMEAYQIRRIAVLLQREITVRVHDAALVPMNVSFGTRVFVKMVCLIPFAGQKGLWCMAVVDAAGVFLQKTDTVRELWKVVDYSE